MKVKIGKVIFVVAPLLLSRTPLQGQDKLPKGELFGGYSYQRASISGGPFVERGNSNGWGVGLTGNFGKNFGATANFTGTYGSVRFYTGSTGFRLYQFLCGPRISLRTPRFTVFGHALAGAMRTNSSKILFPSAILPGISDTRFAMS